MKVNEYRVLQHCVELGVASGWYRARKHSDAPDEEVIKIVVEEAVMEVIAKYFHFEGGCDESTN